MKLLIVTCLKEFLHDASKLLEQASIAIYSTSDIVGHKQGGPANLLSEWFASGHEHFDSRMVFSFTGDENARLALKLIEEYNKNSEKAFPVRAFIVPVEKFV